jgi:hypothetical protein
MAVDRVGPTTMDRGLVRRLRVVDDLAGDADLLGGALFQPRLNGAMISDQFLPVFEGSANR